MTDLNDQNSKPWYLKLHWQVLIALVAGVAFGWLAPQAAENIGFVGDLFLRLLKMIIIPLIFTSLVSGVTSLGSARSVGRVGVRTVLYYTVSTTLAITVGMILVNVIKPGTHLDLASVGSLTEGFSTTSSTLQEFLLRMVPDNIISAMAAGEVLPVIVFALLFGLFLTRLNGPNVEAVKRLVDGVLEVIQALTLAIVKLAPVGIFALLAREVARSGPGIIWDLRYYFVTVGFGLLIHATVTLPLIVLFLGGRSPLTYGRAMAPAVPLGIFFAIAGLGGVVGDGLLLLVLSKDLELEPAQYSHHIASLITDSAVTITGAIAEKNRRADKPARLRTRTAFTTKSCSR